MTWTDIFSFGFVKRTKKSRFVYIYKKINSVNVLCILNFSLFDTIRTQNRRAHSSLSQYVRGFYTLMVTYILSTYNLNDLTLHNHIENALHFLRILKWSQVYTLTNFCSQKYCQQFLYNSHLKLSSLSYYTVHTSLTVNLIAQIKFQFQNKKSF